MSVCEFHLVTSCLGLQEEEPQMAYPLSFTWPITCWYRKWNLTQPTPHFWHVIQHLCLQIPGLSDHGMSWHWFWVKNFILICVIHIFMRSGAVPRSEYYSLLLSVILGLAALIPWFFKSFGMWLPSHHELHILKSRCNDTWIQHNIVSWH